MEFLFVDGVLDFGVFYVLMLSIGEVGHTGDTGGDDRIS